MLTKRCRRLIIAGTTAAAFAPAAITAHAQAAYPAKPVRIIVGMVPGGFTDTSTRIVGSKLADALGQQILVENRPGANAYIAADITAKSSPDGYTLFMSHPGLTTNTLLFEKYPLNPLKDFTAVSLIALIPNILVVHPSVPARTMKELLALARARPENLTQASSGRGSPGHLGGAMLSQMTQTRFVHVPYKGSGAAMIDLIGGHVDLSFPSISAGRPHVLAGRLRALGITSTKRSPLLPEVPTIAEAAVPGFEIVGWYGIVGPAGMPKDVVARLSSEIARALKTPEVREKMDKEGAELIGSTSEEFTAFLKADLDKWTKVIKAARISPVRM